MIPDTRLQSILNGEDIEPQTRLEYFAKNSGGSLPEYDEDDIGKVLTVTETEDERIIVPSQTLVFSPGENATFVAPLTDVNMALLSEGDTVAVTTQYEQQGQSGSKTIEGNYYNGEVTYIELDSQTVFTLTENAFILSGSGASIYAGLLNGISATSTVRNANVGWQTNSEVPDPTSADYGKIIGVDQSGNYDLIDAPSEVPEPTSADYGKIIGVDQSGNYSLIDAPSGGGMAVDSWSRYEPAIWPTTTSFNMNNSYQTGWITKAREYYNAGDSVCEIAERITFLGGAIGTFAVAPNLNYSDRLDAIVTYIIVATYNNDNTPHILRRSITSNINLSTDDTPYFGASSLKDMTLNASATVSDYTMPNSAEYFMIAFKNKPTNGEK